VLYSDTDSAYILVPDGRTKEEASLVAKNIGRELSSNMNFPWPEEFGFKLEDELKYIQFFQEDGVFKKKHYLFVNSEGKLTTKGLRVVKRDCTALSRELYKRYLTPLIKERLTAKFSKDFISSKVEELLREDLSLAARRFNTKESYKSDSCIQAQVRAYYGDGEHKLIKNHRVGAGKKVKYCTVAEARELSSSVVDRTVFYKELAPFIKETSSGGLSAYVS